MNPSPSTPPTPGTPDSLGEPSERLAWRAMQYVLGELSASERAEFELELAASEATCVAVSEAARLVCETRAALVASAPLAASTGPCATTVRRPPVQTLAGRIGVGLAAAVCLAVGLRLASPPSAERVRVEDVAVRSGDSASVPQTVLATMWLASAHLAPEAASGPEDAAEHFLPRGAVLDAEVTDFDHADDAVPGWMFAALALEQTKMPSGLPEKVEEN